MKKQKLLSHNKKIWYEMKNELIRNNNKRILVLSATGTGKSYIGSTFIRYLRIYKKIFGKTIIIVNSVSNIDQWKNVLSITNYENHNIEFLTYTKLCRNDMDFTMIEDADIIIADEVHHIGSKKAKRIFDHIRPDTYVLGLSADARRYSDKDLSDVSIFFDNTITGLSINEAMEEGILNKVEYHVGLFALKEEELNNLRTKISKQSIESSRDRLLKDLDTLSSTAHMKLTLDKYLPKKVKGIIFVRSFDEIAITKSLFADMYPNAAIYTISSLYSKTEYDRNLRSFKDDTSDMSFIISVDVMNEGHHIDGTNVCIFLRKTKSMQIYNQQFGRIVSSSNDYTSYCFDFVNNINTLEDIMVNMDSNKLSSYDNTETDIVSDIKKRFYGERKSYKIQYVVDTELIDFMQRIKDINRSYHWQPWEDEIIRTRYESEGTAIIKDLPDRSKDAITLRANKLGIRSNNNRLVWQPWEDEIVKTRYPSEGVNIAKYLPGRTDNSIIVRASNLGIKYDNSVWKSWEDEIIKTRYPSEGAAVLKDLPGKSKKALFMRASNLGIKYDAVSWKAWEDDIIKSRYLSEGYAIMKDLPGRTKGAIRNRAKRLGIDSYTTNSKWQTWEDEIIKTRYPSEGMAILKDLPGRSKKALSYRVSKLKVSINK